MKRPLSVSSPTHALALSVQFVLGLCGFLGVFGFADGSSVVQAMGNGNSDIWATTLMIFGWGAMSSAIAAKKSRRPEHNLRLEKIFSIGLSINLFYLIGVAINEYGPRSFTLVMFAGAFALGFLFRAIQLFFERRLIKRAREHPETADPVMADPRDESDR